MVLLVLTELLVCACHCSVNCLLNAACSRFAQEHEFEKPNDLAALELMDKCAQVRSPAARVPLVAESFICQASERHPLTVTGSLVRVRRRTHSLWRERRVQLRAAQGHQALW